AALCLSVFGLLGCEGRGCLVEGRTYRDGMRWTCADGCNFCSCDDGVYGHTQMGCGPAPTDAGDGQAPIDSGTDAGKTDVDSGMTVAGTGASNDASVLPVGDARVNDARADNLADDASRGVNTTATLPTTGEQNCDS